MASICSAVFFCGLSEAASWACLRAISSAVKKGILSGHFAVNPYTENGRSIAPYVEQFKAITGFEANLHLGQARQLEKLDASKFDRRPTGEKLRQAWLEKMREELEK